MMPLEAFKYAFANSLSDADAAACYERYAVPESRRVPQDSLTKTGRVDFSRPHPPILFVCGSKDQIVPPVLNRKNYEKFAAHDKHTG